MTKDRLKALTYFAVIFSSLGQLLDFSTTMYILGTNPRMHEADPLAASLMKKGVFPEFALAVIVFYAGIMLFQLWHLNGTKGWARKAAVMLIIVCSAIGITGGITHTYAGIGNIMKDMANSKSPVNPYKNHPPNWGTA
jgi:hypothetical protein